MDKSYPQHIKIGRVGEDIARRWLISRGHKIISQNWRLFWSEIDIITLKDTKTFFVEVKTIARDHMSDFEKEGVDPIDNLHEKKIKKLMRAIEIYTSKNNIDDWELIGVLVYMAKVEKIAKVEMVDSI